MPLLTYIHGFETVRTTAGGGMLTARGKVLAACGGSVVGGSIFTPPFTWLNFNDFGARGAGGRKVRFCPAEG